MSFLTDEQRVALRIQHKQERGGRVRDRIKAVLLSDEGWILQQIAKVLLISDQGVRNHIDEYATLNKLRPQNGGPEEKLSKEQSAQLGADLREHIYLYVEDIAAYVQTTFKVAYAIHGLRNWLQRHGFSYKKPAIVPGKANKVQQEERLAEYEKLRGGLPERLLTDLFSPLFLDCFGRFPTANLGGYIRCRYCPLRFESNIGGGRTEKSTKTKFVNSL